MSAGSASSRRWKPRRCSRTARAGAWRPTRPPALPRSSPAAAPAGRAGSRATRRRSRSRRAARRRAGDDRLEHGARVAVAPLQPRLREAAAGARRSAPVPRTRAPPAPPGAGARPIRAPGPSGLVEPLEVVHPWRGVSPVRSYGGRCSCRESDGRAGHATRTADDRKSRRRPHGQERRPRHALARRASARRRFSTTPRSRPPAFGSPRSPASNRRWSWRTRDGTVEGRRRDGAGYRGAVAASSSARRIRFAETWPRVPRPWANWLTRSSSSIHGTSRSAAGNGRPAGHSSTRRRYASSSSSIAAHPVEVAGRVVGQALEPPRRRLQVALDVGQPLGAARGRQARDDQAVDLGLDVAARGRDRLGGERLEAAADVAGGVEDPRDPPDDRSRAVEQLAGDVVAQAAEAGLVPRRAARLGHERVDGRGLGVVEDGADAAVGRARERELGVLRQPVEDVAQRRGDRQEEQAAGAQAHRVGLRLRRLDHAHADARALVDERRIGAQAAAPQLDLARERPDVPGRQPAALELRVRGGQLGPQARGDRLAQRRRARARRRGRGPARPRSRTSSAGARAAARRPTPTAGCARRAAPRARGRARRAAARCAGASARGPRRRRRAPARAACAAPSAARASAP